MSYKCFQCQRQDHTFKNCSEATCMCACVKELVSFPRNESLDKVSPLGPHFLQINNEDVAKLPYPYKQINRFMKIRTREQTKA
ncbi:MAG: hypothetical protein ACREBR_05485 [bacterium]